MKAHIEMISDMEKVLVLLLFRAVIPYVLQVRVFAYVYGSSSPLYLHTYLSTNQHTCNCIHAYIHEYTDDDGCDKCQFPGLYSYANGEAYDGQWNNDMRDGYGKYSYSNGDVFQGFWSKGKKQGKGNAIRSILALLHSILALLQIILALMSSDLL